MREEKQVNKSFVGYKYSRYEKNPSNKISLLYCHEIFNYMSKLFLNFSYDFRNSRKFKGITSNLS